VHVRCGIRGELPHLRLQEWLNPEVPFDAVAEKYLHPYTGSLKWHVAVWRLGSSMGLASSLQQRTNQQLWFRDRHPVHRDVGNVKNDRPDLVKEVKTPKKITSFFSRVPKGMRERHFFFNSASV
jgi:hypothetical protein